MVCPLCRLPQATPSEASLGTRPAFPDNSCGVAFDALLDNWCQLTGHAELSSTRLTVDPTPFALLAAPGQSWLGATLSRVARFTLRHALGLQTQNSAANMALAVFQVRSAAAPLLATHPQHSAAEVVRALAAAIPSIQANRAVSPDAAALAAALDQVVAHRATLRELARLLRELA